tara:strand:- start:1103 stop:1330 length:228 start_codon:yes stop_codon:yes gene_type:complete
VEKWDPFAETEGEKKLWKFLTPRDGEAISDCPMGLVGRKNPGEEGYYPAIHHNESYKKKRLEKVFYPPCFESHFI